MNIFLDETILYEHNQRMGFPHGSVVKNPPAKKKKKKNPPAKAGDAGDRGLNPGLGRSPGKGNGKPLQYSCRDNLMDRATWWPTVHGVTKESDTT